MGGIFKNKFFIILLIVACVLTLTAMILNILGYGSVTTDAVNILIMPFQTFADIVKDSWSGFTGYFTEFNKMKEELAQANERITELEEQIEDTKDIIEKNIMYELYFNFMEVHTNIKRFQDAVVIGREAGNYQSNLIINKGSVHNIENNMPVVTDKGIVGYISKVGIWTSEVSLFIRTSNNVGAYIKRTSQIGIVEGEFSLEKEGKCLLGSLYKDTDLQVGDKIYTTGFGDIYPKDLYIGKVTEVLPDSLSQSMTGHIEPAVDFNELRRVMIILEFDREFY